DLDRPLVVDQRAEEVVQPDERLPHARAQVDAVVEGAALAALVAPDVRLPDGLRPVDRIEERDGLVADGLQAGQGHLDELPLDEVEQAPVPSGRPCEGFGSGVEPSEAAAARNLSIAATISACPPPGPLLWRSAAVAHGRVWGQYSSTIFTASCRVVRRSGAAPSRAAFSRQRSRRARRTAYL